MKATTTVTGTWAQCPACSGGGFIEVYDGPGSDACRVCDACDGRCVIALPVSPDVRDAIGEETMYSSGLEWDGLESEAA